MKSFKIFMLAALMFFAAACASNAQDLLVSKTYYHTGLSFDGSQWSQGPQSGALTFTVYEESLHTSDGTRAVRRGYGSAHGFSGRKYVTVDDRGVESPRHYYLVSNNLDIAMVIELTFTFYGFTSSSVNLTLYSQVPVNNNGGGNYNSGGNFNSGGNYNNGNSGTNRQWVTCTLCNGTGVWKKNYAPKYNGQSITEWCDICKGYDHKHYHETCTSCNGKGGYYR